VAEEQLPNNDVLYREGLNALNRTTYTPRLLSVDLAGNLGHLPVTGELYGNFVQRDEELLPLGTGEELQQARQQAEESGVSAQRLDVHEKPPAVISEYQRDLLKNSVAPEKNYQLAETANSWADFLYARYHPRTLNVLPGLVRDPNVQALGSYSAGAELWQEIAFNDCVAGTASNVRHANDFAAGLDQLLDHRPRLAAKLLSGCQDHGADALLTGI